MEHSLERSFKKRITHKSNRKLSKSFLAIYLVISVTTLFSSLFLTGISWLSFSMFVISLLLFFPIFRFLKSFADLDLYGENVVVNQFPNSHKVIELKSFRRIKSKSIFGNTFSKITYYLDGQRYEIRVYWTMNYLFSIDEVVQTLRTKASKKENKS